MTGERGVEGCKYCELLEKKPNLLYEDDVVIAVIPEKPATKGHVQIIAKKHHETLQDIDDKELEHLFYAASFSATALFENLGAEGTNIIANTGGELKKGGHFHLDVLARKGDDGLNLLWTPKKLPDGDMDSVKGSIKDKCDVMGDDKKENEVVDLDKKPEKLESGEESSSESDRDEGEKNEKDGKNPDKKDKSGKKKEDKEGEESYLIKQLRRVP